MSEAVAADVVGCSLAIHCLAAVADALIQLRIKNLISRTFRLTTCVGGFCLRSGSLFPCVIRGGGGFFQCGGAGTQIENFLILVVNFENGDPINWIHFRMN